MDRDIALQFAEHWIEAWNSHDLDRIMSHYAEDFAMSSPIIKLLTSESSGVIKGKEPVRQYWAKALERTPDMKFELIGVYTGVNSLLIHYHGHRGRSAEIFHFDGDGMVIRAFAHYE